VIIFINLFQFGCGGHTRPEIERVLSSAGTNRGELESVLEHYRDRGEAQKLAAAEFLIANMEKHGFVEAAFYGEDEIELDFNALDYPDYNTAEAVLDSLEAEHGSIRYSRKRFVKDVETITADFLIEHIDLAFRSWREKPWARGISFEAFCEFILPYRGSNEPLSQWRQPCLDRLVDLPLRMNNPDDIIEAGELIRQEVRDWVGFSELYYLHPTDQGFDEMISSGLGRCEDIGNMMSFAMRANSVLCANDYTPFWAHRDNNHAWEVLLDPDGNGSAPLDNVPAKVYRKMFSIQPGNLGCIKEETEKVPRWLAGKSYRDVTSSYVTPSDLVITLTETPSSAQRFAYICVFNGGEWEAIHWGRIKDGQVIFRQMGRDIAYLPAYFIDETLVPAADPFILTSAGEIVTLRSDDGVPIAVRMSATTPETPDADTHAIRKPVKIEPVSYTLYLWDNEWVPIAKKDGSETGELTIDLPSSGGLYWLVAEDSRRLERIFTVEGKRVVFW